jgi:hypothetical protein
MLNVGLATASALLCLSTIARADGPLTLTDRQLDRVTAGGAIVFGTADAGASGIMPPLAQTNVTTIVGSSPGPVTPETAYAGLASGTAVSFGSNGLPSTPAPYGPATSNTSVGTAGGADGNYTLTISGAGTSSALGLTIQVGTTYVYGAFVPGL